jgi:hypothetical protein
MKRDLYAEVSKRIVAELERGAAPWIKPWSATAGMNTPCNALTNRPYSGSNVVLLWMAQTAGYRTPRFLTFKQALELGGNVRKGEHGTKVYFVKQLQVADRNCVCLELRSLPSTGVIRFQRVNPIQVWAPGTVDFAKGEISFKAYAA